MAVMTASEGRASTNNRKGGFFETGNVSGKIGQLSLEIREADRQIMGLVNLKKLKNAEIDRLNNLMVEEARNGTLYKEE